MLTISWKLDVTSFNSKNVGGFSDVSGSRIVTTEGSSLKRSPLFSYVIQIFAMRELYLSSRRFIVWKIIDSLSINILND